MKYFVLVAVIVLALLGLLAGKLPSLWRLNQTALQTAGFMAFADLAPDWWLHPATPEACGQASFSGPLPTNGRFAARQLRLLGLIDLACGDREQAAALFQRAGQSDGFDPTLPLLLKVAAAAPEEGHDGVLSGAASWGVVVEQARKAFEQGDHETAAQLLDSVRNTLDEPAQPDRRALYLWACFIYRGARQLPSSLAACERLVEVSPENKEAWNSLGLTLLAQRRWQEAEQAFARAVALDERWPVGLTNLGRALVAQERSAEAHPYFEQTLALDPDEPWANYYLALDALAAGQCEKAQAHAQTVIRSDNARLAREAQKLVDQGLKTCQ